MNLQVNFALFKNRESITAVKAQYDSTENSIKNPLLFVS